MSEEDEKIAVFGCAESVHFKARRRRVAGCGDIPQAGIGQATYFNWKKKYETLTPPEMRLKQLEEENTKLKKLVVDLPLGCEMLQDIVRRKTASTARKRELVVKIYGKWDVWIQRVYWILAARRATCHYNSRR